MENGNPYIMAIIAQIGVGFTAICSLFAVIIQVRAGGKQKKQDDLVKAMNTKLDNMKEESTEADRKINAKIDEQQFRYYKDQLIVMMSRIQNGYVPTQEEKYILHEQKAKYNSLGGDSYVDEMFDKLVQKDLI